MLQHTSSEVIIIQLQINFNSKNNCTDWELTKMIDIKRQEYANNRDEVSHVGTEKLHRPYSCVLNN